jgi:hypothetical protein
VTGRFEPPLVNIGVGDDLTIAELAHLVRDVALLGHRLRPQRTHAHVRLLSSTGYDAVGPSPTALARAS